MLPLLAMQPLSQGSTLGTATILEVGWFRQMKDGIFMMQIFRFSPLKVSPGALCLQLRAKVLTTDFRPPTELQCINVEEKIEEYEQNRLHSCKMDSW